MSKPLLSSHPEGNGVSTLYLYHLLAGEQTMSADKDLFLAETYRLHPDIAQSTSKIYYEGRIETRPDLKQQAIVANGGAASPFTGSGLVYVPVSHTESQARSPEEVEVVQKIVDDLTSRYCWRDKGGSINPLTTQDILVFVSYNARVSTLVEAMPPLAKRIDTVDRFQVQEAPVVIYSMTSSKPDEAPREMEFLYNRFRFNVAMSRAQVLCLLRGQSGMPDATPDEDGERLLPVRGARQKHRGRGDLAKLGALHVRA